MMVFKCSKYTAHYAFFLLLGLHISLIAQERISRAEYIQQWSRVAIREMQTSGIPASIKMAQALLESDDGNSYLAREGNNHFGIKCHTGWTGDVIHKDDDSRNECFRKYENSEESFRDHSLFLRGRERYAHLFDLEPTDYKRWAKGLKDAGYATNPHYAAMLVRIIEENGLYKLDQPGEDAGSLDGYKGTITQGQAENSSLERGKVNDVKVVFASDKDTYRRIADELGLNEWMLRKFNEVDKEVEPTPGGVVYIQPKRNRCSTLEHLSKGGESLWQVSMLYGIKVKRLERLNALDREDRLVNGQRVLLR